jgi:hypothetical protein
MVDLRLREKTDDFGIPEKDLSSQIKIFPSTKPLAYITLEYKLIEIDQAIQNNGELSKISTKDPINRKPIHKIAHPKNRSTIQKMKDTLAPVNLGTPRQMI